MLGGYFKEELRKNNVLFNKSNKFGRLFYRNFNGKKELTLYGNTYLNYCYLVLETTNASVLKVFYKNILVSCVSGSKQTFVPIAIENNSQLVIEGGSEILKISLFGAKFYNESCDYVVPLQKYKVENTGKWLIKSYNNKDDFVNGNLPVVREYDKLLSSQVFKLAGNTFYADLYEDDGVYLCSNNDNYTEKINIVEGGRKAIIAPTDLNNIYVIYIENSKLYFKTITDFNKVSDRFEIDKKSNLVPIGFCPIEVYGFYANIFAVVWNNGSITIFEISDNGISIKTTIKGNKVKLQMFDDSLNIVKIDDYGVGIYRYVLSSGSVIPKDNEYYNFVINVNDYYLIDNSNLYFNCENCVEY